MIIAMFDIFVAMLDNFDKIKIDKKLFIKIVLNLINLLNVLINVKFFDI